ncbi:MAG: glycosyltransferase family 2 protein [Anaerolineales bacterium]|jgi:GT2 family glycosyltransferase
MDITGMIKSIVWSIFPPGSKIERFFRTQFHRLTSNKVYIYRNIQQSKNSYKKWFHFQEKECLSRKKTFEYQPRISFFLIIEPSEYDLAVTTINSILAQLSENWELIILSSDQLPPESKLYRSNRENRKIKYYVKKEKTLQFFMENSSGSYFLCCNPGDTFESYFIDENYKIINLFPDTEIIYSDIDSHTNKKSKPIPFFKPDIYSPELHLSINFLSRAIIKKSVAETKTGDINPKFNLLNQEWDLLFLLTEERAIIKHIPWVLVHQTQSDYRNTEHECQVIERHLKRIGIKSKIAVKRDQETRIKWKFEQPSVSIIIPTKNKYKLLKNLIDSLFKITDYKNFEVILVDNDSDEEDLKSFYSNIIKEYPIQIINYREQFNYSRANNLGASFSHSELLLFMNNDMEIVRSDWLTELCQWAMLPDLGVIGAKLLHADNSIQHAGIIMGMQGIVGHLYINAPEHYYGLLGSVDWYHNFYAVTGACQMIRKNLFDELGGYNEDFQLVFSDIELCLKVIKKGYRILYTPNAELRHLEGKSRGYETPKKDILLGYNILNEWIIKDDPFFSHNLTYTAIPKCHIGGEDISQRMNQINERKKYLL